jgi:hypothetical protein
MNEDRGGGGGTGTGSHGCTAIGATALSGTDPLAATFPRFNRGGETTGPEYVGSGTVIGGPGR